MKVIFIPATIQITVADDFDESTFTSLGGVVDIPAIDMSDDNMMYGMVGAVDDPKFESALQDVQIWIKDYTPTNVEVCHA